jgi:hypothetical protein
VIKKPRKIETPEETRIRFARRILRKNGYSMFKREKVLQLFWGLNKQVIRDALAGFNSNDRLQFGRCFEDLKL